MSKFCMSLYLKKHVSKSKINNNNEIIKKSI
jgi:hypothetical protein